MTTFDKFRNCITEPRCRDCEGIPGVCEEEHQSVSIPKALALDVLELLKEHENLEKRHEILVNHADTMLAILKERNEKIAVLNRFIEQMPKPTKLLDVFCDGYAKIVRCKYCENKECEGREGRIVCGITGEDHLPDWFCADGEPKEQEAKPTQTAGINKIPLKW